MAISQFSLSEAIALIPLTPSSPELTNQPIILFFVLFFSGFFLGLESVCVLTNQPIIFFFVLFFQVLLDLESVCFLTFPSSYDKTSPSFQLTVRAHKCQLSPLSALHHLCHLNPLLYTKLFHFGICGFTLNLFELSLFLSTFLEEEKLKKIHKRWDRI